MTAQRQSSVLLLSVFDKLLEQSFNLEEIMEDAHSGAVQPPGTRDSYGIQDSPIPVPVGELNPTHPGLVFPGVELEKPDLSAFLLDGEVL